jgi:hypothetical protein
MASSMALVSCKKEDEVVPPAPTPPVVETDGRIVLKMHYMLGGNEVLPGSTYQLNGLDVSFDRLQFYAHDFTFFPDDPESEGVVLEDFYILAGLGANEFDLGEVALQHIHTMKFKIGVDPATNGQSEDDFVSRPASDPLSPQSPTMHWSWAVGSGYKFIAIEGQYNGQQEFVYHTATDPLLRETPMIMVHEDNPVNGEIELHLKLDLEQVFNGIDIQATPVAHGINGSNGLLSDNFSVAFSVMH